MKALAHLAAQALIGIERQPPAWPEAPGAVGDLLRQLAEAPDEPARKLLRMAGVLAVCGAAGYRPPPSSPDAESPCPPETLRTLDDPPLLAALARALNDGPERLRAEALGYISTAGACLPYRLLPAALELGRQSRALRPFLWPALGRRGVWLALRNPEWRYAAEADSDVQDDAAWETGTLERRLAYLRRARTLDPARGRELYAQALPELDAKERAALLAEFAAGLGGEDEAPLQAALLDRSKEVRQTAAGLLARLPDSGYAMRMAARLEACLTETRKLLVKTVLNVEAPESFGGAEWKNDALEEAKPKSEPLGQRAWWLYQLARAAPLSWWTARTGWTPGEILDWALKSEWREALWRGWLEAAIAGPNPPWLEAFLARKPPKAVPYDLAEMLRPLPPHVCETHWLDIMEREGRGAGLAFVCASLPLTSGPVSAEFARAALGRVRDYLGQPEAVWDYRLREAVPQFACLIPPESWPELLAERPLDRPDAPPSLHDTAARFHAVLELRAALRHHFLPASDST